MRIAAVAATLLACAAAVMTVAAFTAGGEGELPSSPPRSVAGADGKAVWVAQGCGSCHAFAAASATGQFAPDLALSLRGMPASYIRESIVAPSKVIAAGYSGGGMPEDFAARMSRAELERLVDFIRSGVRD